MSDDSLSRLINQLIDGTISEEDHSELQRRLRADSHARSVFRERMDLEASLHTWASEETPKISPAKTSQTGNPDQVSDRFASRSTWAWLGVAATIAAAAFVSFVWLAQYHKGDQTRITEGPRQNVINTNTTSGFGRLIQQANCQWTQPSPENGRFSIGLMELSAGAAELRFDSGTNVILEAPCAIQIESADSANLLAGTVFVDVTEVSNGFLLTTPEANIIDEGTQYAVTLDSDATEVHVFDGSVIWTTPDNSPDFEDRIASGEARRFTRGQPDRPQRIPFGKRQFVKRIEAEIRDVAGEQLLAYDGFENIAGRLRRGRSGFGWTNGWGPAGRGYGQLAEVIDAPHDTVFGVDRSGRRMLYAHDVIDMRRHFSTPVDFSSQNTVYVSLIVHRTQVSTDRQTAFQILLEPDADSPRYTRRHSVSFGITSTGAMYVNNAGKVLETATNFPDDQTCLLVFRYVGNQPISTAALRVYAPGDLVEEEPTAWTVSEVQSTRAGSFHSIRIRSGGGSWRVDELRIGTSWSAVTGSEDRTE